MDQMLALGVAIFAMARILCIVKTERKNRETTIA
jgi:hypothetical protein